MWSEDLICRGHYLGPVLVFLTLTHHTSQKCVASQFLQVCALKFCPNECKVCPSSTHFNGASSPHLRTQLTDIIVSLLYIERNENKEITNLYQRPSLCAIKLSILFVAIEINE